MSNTLNEENETGIALWGPVGSGKDWLINGFARELAFFNKANPDFLFELNDEDGTPINPKAPSKKIILPTAEAVDYFLRFTRRPTAEEPDHAHSISAYSHDINIHNDKGGHLMSVLTHPEGHEYTYRTLMDSRYIIVVLDPTLISSAPRTNSEQISKPDLASIIVKESFTQNEYRLAIQTLLTTFSKEANQKRYLAICLTKMDKKSVRGSSWDLLRRLFGVEMYELLLNYKRKFEIEVFSTSAAGFIKNPGSIGPRVSNEDGGIITDENNWNPVNTATPFFWIFENKEKDKLKNSGFLKDYIEYPTRPN